MKVRYVIEHAAPSDYHPFCLDVVDSDGDSILGPVGYVSVEHAQADAEPGVTWKEAPKDWQPDALLVSSWFEWEMDRE